MISLACLAALLASGKLPAVSETVGPGGLRHPGITLNAQDLRRIQRHVQAGDEPWRGAFARCLSERKDFRTDYAFEYRGETTVDHPGIDDRMSRDGDAAYSQLIAYALTGEGTYWRNVRALFDRYFAGIKDGRGHWDAHFRWGSAMRGMCKAAELFRAVEPPPGDRAWTQEDAANLCRLMDIGAAWADSRNAWMNQHQACEAGLLAYAVFRDDAEGYRLHRERILVNSRSGDWGGNGSISNLYSGVAGNHQLAEMGRDIGHPFTCIYFTMDPLHTLIAQEPDRDFLAAFGHAYVKSLNYAYKYNLGFDVAWHRFACDFKNGRPVYFDKISNAGGGRGRTPGAAATWLFNEYCYRRKWRSANPDFRYVAWVHRLCGEDPLELLLFTPESAQGRYKEPTCPYGSPEENRRVLANWLLPEDCTGASCEESAEGRYLHITKRGLALPYYMANGRFLKAGTVRIRYRSRGNAAIGLVNPMDETTEKDATGRYRLVSRLDLPSTDGEWQTHETELPEAVDRALVKLRFGFAGESLDIRWLENGPIKW